MLARASNALPVFGRRPFPYREVVPNFAEAERTYRASCGRAWVQRGADN
jgi:hypothetical protein